MIRIASMVGAPDLNMPTLAPFSGDLANACLQLKKMGFDGIELMSRRPGLLDKTALKQCLAENDLVLVGLCTGHLFAEDHLELVPSTAEINQQAFDRMREFIEAAAQLIGPGGMFNIGRSRGMGDPLRPQRTLDCLQEALQQLADEAASFGVKLALEPISRSETNFIHSTQDGLEMIRRVNRPNLGLNLDTYHMFREDVDPIASLHEAADVAWHIHFSDSNRRWPGSATIPFERVISALEDIHYPGFVSLEIQPWPDPMSAAQNSIQHLRKLITEVGDQRQAWH